MTGKQAVEKYLLALKGIDGGRATEFTYRTPLENLLRELAPAGAKIVQEPQRETDIGAPDFRIENKSGAIVGYAECKKPGADLDSLARGEQIKKYKNLSPNILLTDYWSFIALREGAKFPPAFLRGAKKDIGAAEELLRRFLNSEPQKIGDSETLARALAERCRILRKPLTDKLNSDAGRLSGIFKAFREAIYRDISETDFADALAQTLVYGLLTAKLNMKNGGALELHNVKKHIPQNFLLLREIAGFLDELDEPQYADIAYLVEDILNIVNHMDAAAVGESMSYRGGKTVGDDPYLYFYEHFLAAYDAKLQKSRGVYYTPPPVVRFIVRAADDILRRDFGLADGLADERVTALDFAAGTGTFMLEMFKLVFGGSAPARRDILTRRHLLKNFFGFELLLAPFAIAHLKLSQFLKDSGADLGDDDRINVFLTNTLEHIGETPELHFMPALAAEAKRAQEIKAQKILVITGNPPYSGVSQNKGMFKDEIEAYKYVDGRHFREVRHWLHDDYVKFIRFAQRKIDAAGEGVVAVITNHAFLDNPTFRGMRESLLRSFDRLYFLDLHGNSQRNERAPDGGKDENVFSVIRQGVAISLLVKKKGMRKGVFRADLFGARAQKHEWCEERRVRSVKWEKIKPASPFYFFAPSDREGFDAYRDHWQITDMFSGNVSGFQTARDHFAVSFDRKTMRKRIADMRDVALSDDKFREKYELKNARNWDLSDARKVARKLKDVDRHIRQCSFRPFDNRFVFYHKAATDWGRYNSVMRHMRAGDNLGLVTVRQVAENDFNHAIVANAIVDTRMTLSNRGGAYIFPLYRYDEVGGDVRRENFNPEFRRWIDDRYGVQHSPEKILGCIYAILHSPKYREQYAEFLRMDFPRIPFPKENGGFLRLAEIGEELIAAHLLKTKFGEGAELCGDGVSHLVEQVRYSKANGGRLYFNKDEYFSPIPPEVFDFQIGGYKPLDKFLKSRKGRKLSGEECQTMENAARAISFTILAQKKIDGV